MKKKYIKEIDDIIIFVFSALPIMFLFKILMKENVFALYFIISVFVVQIFESHDLYLEKVDAFKNIKNPIKHYLYFGFVIFIRFCLTTFMLYSFYNTFANFININL
jgi:hypothetical protein